MNWLKLKVMWLRSDRGFVVLIEIIRIAALILMGGGALFLFAFSTYLVIAILITPEIFNFIHVILGFSFLGLSIFCLGLFLNYFQQFLFRGFWR